MMRIPIVTYHAIEEGPAPLFVSPARFRADMEALAEAGCQTISLDALLGWLRGGTPLPNRPVVITFDDGYASVYENARPVLDSLGYSATLFLVTDYCGRDNGWPSQPPWVLPRRLLNWDEIGEMAAAGYEIGAHSCTHPRLTSVSADSAAEEIRRSGEVIAGRLGRHPACFAFPYGLTNPFVSEQTRQQFAGAVTTRLRMVTPQSDPFFLERLDAYYLSPRWLRRMDSPLFPRYLQLRRALQVARKRLHTAR